jgi:hypothetical protein
MSKQALIDHIWRERLLTHRTPAPPPARVPALRPEPRMGAIPIPWKIVAGTALASFAGFCLGTALRGARDRPPALRDEIDWESGLS